MVEKDDGFEWDKVFTRSWKVDEADCGLGDDRFCEYQIVNNVDFLTSDHETTLSTKHHHVSHPPRRSQALPRVRVRVSTARSISIESALTMLNIIQAADETKAPRFNRETKQRPMASSLAV